MTPELSRGTARGLRAGSYRSPRSAEPLFESRTLVPSGRTGRPERFLTWLLVLVQEGERSHSTRQIPPMRSTLSGRRSAMFSRKLRSGPSKDGGVEGHLSCLHAGEDIGRHKVFASIQARLDPELGGFVPTQAAARGRGVAWASSGATVPEGIVGGGSDRVTERGLPSQQGLRPDGRPRQPASPRLAATEPVDPM